MTTITVNASKTYDVHIGQDMLKNAGNAVKNLLSPQKCVIVTDDIVNALYGDVVESSLKDSGIETFRYVFPNGEQSKSAEVYFDILNFLACSELSRTDAVIALGGGVAGDLAGFAAATYMRGVGLVQIPTTLLAMVDSSVGGKTAIDLPGGKNLCGAFYQPDLVLCDTDTLKTLPRRIFLDGCAEVIKYGCIGSIELLKHLELHGLDFDRSYVIPLCVQMKRDIVAEDEFDRGARQLLNLGHTAGHAIEKLSGYWITHGNAVAIGLAIISESAKNAGFCTEEDYGRITDLLRRFSFKLNHSFTAEEILPFFTADKKRSGSSITAVVPVNFGESRLVKMSISEFAHFITSGVEKWT